MPTLLLGAAGGQVCKAGRRRRRPELTDKLARRLWFEAYQTVLKS
jgi:hypothetical protein